jgi:hypothetical protein
MGALILGKPTILWFFALLPLSFVLIILGSYGDARISLCARARRRGEAELRSGRE